MLHNGLYVQPYQCSVLSESVNRSLTGRWAPSLSLYFFLSLLENYTSDTAAGSEPWPALRNLSLRHQVVAHICLLLLGDVGVHTRGLALFLFAIF